MHMRGYRPSDEGAVYDICLRTGAAGQDAAHLVADPLLLGHVYAGAYLKGQPELASVLDDGAGTPVGYVLGALDTAAFERWCERDWWPPLRARYPEPAELRTWDDRLVRAMYHWHSAPPELVAGHPSHLHIDLLPAAQGGGWGRRLMDRLLDQLQAAGSAGVHFGVAPANTGALAFYRRLGFTDLAADEHTVYLGRAW